MLATIDWVLLFIGVGIAWCTLCAVRPWHKPEQWRVAPVEIRLVLWFSLAVVFADFVILGALSDLRESWNPYLGRSQLFVYVVSSITAMTLCRERTNRARWILIGLLALWSVLSLWRFVTHPERPGETDPSRMVSPYQLLWTVGIPVLWMAVLLSPRVKRYCLVGRSAALA